MNYTVIRSRRRTVSIQVTPQGQVLVRCPLQMAERDIRRFLEQKGDWIQKHMPKESPHPQFTPAELATLTQQAKAYVPQRVTYFAEAMGISYGRVTIRAQHTRWGSCSSKGNLNFNCLLMLAPPEVVDYVVVHELCHRKELNHSRRFWAEVARVLPDYSLHRRWLKEHGAALIARLPRA